MVKKFSKIVYFILLSCVFFKSELNELYGAGFAVRNQSASSLGTALSSDTTQSVDASGIFSNPALLTVLSKNQVTFGLNITTPRIQYKDMKLFRATRADISNRGGASQNEVDRIFRETKKDLLISKPSLIPSIYGNYSLNDEWSFGLMFLVPWATSSEYEQDWIGRYHAKKTKLVAYNFTPVLGYSKKNSNVGIGVGLQIQMAEGELSSVADWCLKVIKEAKSCGKNLSNPKLDALVYYKGSSTDVGYVLGAVIDPSKRFRVGFSLRSKIEHKSKGKVTINPVEDETSAYNDATAKDVESSLVLSSPLVLSLGMRYFLKDNIKLYSNVTLTQWSVVKNLTLDIAGSLSVTKLNYQDSFYYSIGSEYSLDLLDLRFGFAFEESAVVDKYRSPRTPDQNRYIVSTGLGYQFGNFRIDGGYAFYLFKEATIRLLESDYAGAKGRGDFSADINTTAHVAMVAITYKN